MIEGFSKNFIDYGVGPRLRENWFRLTYSQRSTLCRQTSRIAAFP